MSVQIIEKFALLNLSPFNRAKSSKDFLLYKSQPIAYTLSVGKIIIAPFFKSATALSIYLLSMFCGLISNNIIKYKIYFHTSQLIALWSENTFF